MNTAPAEAALHLPPGFIWGTSTSSYQIEGAARQDGRGLSIWDTHCQRLGRVLNGDTGDIACDHYHRFAEDIALMQAIGIQAYRFSLAWPRLLPRGRGAINPKGLDFYDRLIDGLLAAGIEPWICLFHWDLPQALQDLGGWSNRDSVGWFADYAMLAARRYGDRVKHWATFNEQSVSTIFGYAWNWSPPAIADLTVYYKTVHHQNLAHGAAIEVLRRSVPQASLGIVHNRQVVYPDRHDPAHQAAVAIMDTHWNLIFPDPQILGHYPPSVAEAVEPFLQAGDLSRICQPLDWFGLNHYGPLWACVEPDNPLGFAMGSGPDGTRLSDIDWAVDPDAFRRELLATCQRYRLPVYVTENGFGSDKETPDANGYVEDSRRIEYLRDYTAALSQAIAQGADVRGYFVWSLLDNFEWGSGYAFRFGIHRVDYATQQRTPKASAHWYAQLIKAHSGA